MGILGMLMTYCGRLYVKLTIPASTAYLELCTAFENAEQSPPTPLHLTTAKKKAGGKYDTFYQARWLSYLMMMKKMMMSMINCFVSSLGPDRLGRN
ncbi:uncharacterized protein ATNIH1004_010457 [Aspergillus tanneri]|uniref:Uncharacterized protein n=1 Tax=Aspergillus tanneri TaxID=1220188 RepID=A0A5M9MFD6_9EURO|nr:uncharacterized protein ATNIH1004_010457 [Aspergillus tanneri]KAA8643683.1 hypothetical protein ATNIH1004_010457 [Aspergillus tanneri]